jgi:hypothetical protein
VGAEAPVEGLLELGHLRPQFPEHQARQDRRVALPGDERLDDLAGGDAPDGRGDRGELDAGVLEGLLQALDLPAPGVDLGLAVPGELAQLRISGGGTKEGRSRTIKLVRRQRTAANADFPTGAGVAQGYQGLGRSVTRIGREQG